LDRRSRSCRARVGQILQRSQTRRRELRIPPLSSTSASSKAAEVTTGGRAAARVSSTYPPAITAPDVDVCVFIDAAFAGNADSTSSTEGDVDLRRGISAVPAGKTLSGEEDRCFQHESRGDSKRAFAPTHCSRSSRIRNGQRSPERRLTILLVGLQRSADRSARALAVDSELSVDRRRGSVSCQAGSDR
jgi:hypothetical protein